MPILDPISFQGTISTGATTMAVRFVAGIDDDGSLEVALGPFLAGPGAIDFFQGRVPLQPMQALSLHGLSEDRWRFSSDHFYVTSLSHPEGHIQLAGESSLAEFSHDVAADHPDMRAWYVRRLGTFHGIEKDTPLGRLVFVGRPTGSGQVPSAILAMHAEGQGLEGWWEESERFLIHLERVLSFACDSYLIPIFEERVRGGERVLRTAKRGRTADPYLQPFDMLHMYEIFDCAIQSFADRADAVVRLDPAIRWMTAPAASGDSRLINAMSALESIVAHSDHPALFMEDEAAFRALRAKVRRFLRAENAPSRMGGKVDELNRRSFRDKVEDLLNSREIVTTDFPENWLGSIIAARNIVIHTGVAPDFPSPDARLLDHIVWAREIVTRIILDAIGFEGQYRSWLHQDQYLSFPGCRQMSEVAREREAARSSAEGQISGAE